MVNRNQKDGLKSDSIFKFVWITFQSEKIKKDQNYLNRSISEGYHIVQEYHTPTGLVFSLMKSTKNPVENIDQKVMEDYGFDSKIGGLQK